MTLLSIPITKGGKLCHFDVDTDMLNDPDFPVVSLTRIVEEGLKVLLNSRQSKLLAPTNLTGEKLEENKVLALKQAQQNFDDLLEGKLVKRGSASKAAAPREVMTEARRLAKETVKTEIRNSGMKPSLVAPADITAAANELLAQDPSYIATAEANIAARKQVVSKIDIKSKLAESPKLKEKAEAAAAARKAELSAKQAAMPEGTKKRGGKVIKAIPRKPAPKPDLGANPDFGTA